MQRPFVVLRTHGSGWDESRPMEEQTNWPAHAAFMDSLAAEGFIALGGPLEGTRDALLVIRAEDSSEIEQRLSADPWTRNGLLITKECWPWRIRLGSLAAPEGWHTVTPRIVVAGAEQLVAFIQQVFGAAGEYRATIPSELRIGDSVVLISDVGVRHSMTAFLYVYVNDTDATYRLALNAGARSIEEPFDTPYGDRRCMVEDNWGNTWQIATRL